MLSEEQFLLLQDKILDAFYESSAVNDTIWFDAWTTLYEELMFILCEYVDKED